MMGNLFSIFDPSTQILSLSLNWGSLLLLLFIFPYSFWMFYNSSFLLVSKVASTLKAEFSTLLGPSAFQGATLLFIALFFMILIVNVLGLMPYIFTPTSHPLLTVTLALPVWVAIILYGWVNHTFHMLAHLVPEGTPGPLMVFMVCIETVSNIIRPLTLSVRLAANMIAGHLLLTLLGNQGAQMPTLMLPLLLGSQLLLLTLESAVAMIQAYVFTVLSSLYMSEST
uniref:ATP synthase subunit a n=1 Tax=Antrokoreana gracilipes TaxID=364406 RepID=A9X4I2_ANTGC|nr:ATP synthase F0 subunit 6 [Antrokoreana gracilipes]ABC55882.1 ATP synthase F0 subunit 6 [Antrokoreana gracilipes]